MEINRQALLNLFTRVIVVVVIATGLNLWVPRQAHAIRLAADTPCTEEVVYVCGTKDGQRKTYQNKCLAEKDGAV
jgi:hypothetical protein